MDNKERFIRVSPVIQKGNRLIFLYMVRWAVIYLSVLLFSVWICRGDSNERHNGNNDPMQSYLFCIKAYRCHSPTSNSWWVLSSNSMELDLFWEILFTCFNRGSNFIGSPCESVCGVFNQRCKYFPITVYRCCSLKNDVSWKKFHSFSDHVVPITASGPQG